jgi:hypothetical protein
MGNASSADELGEMFLDMWEEGWVDPQTRAVIIDFTVYNPSRQLMTVVKVLAEFTAMGKVLPSHSIRTFRYKQLWNTEDVGWWVDCSLLLMVVFYGTCVLRNQRSGLSSRFPATNDHLPRQARDKQT